MWSIMRPVFNMVYRETPLAPRCFYICTEYYKYICNPLVIYYYYNIYIRNIKFLFKSSQFNEDLNIESLSYFGNEILLQISLILQFLP